MFTAYVGGFELMPHPRLHHSRIAQRLNKRVQAYYANRDELAWKIKELMQSAGARTHEAPVSLTAHVALSHRRRCDIDNLLKTLLDALQESTLIRTDDLVENVNITLSRGASNPCIGLKLMPLQTTHDE